MEDYSPKLKRFLKGNGCWVVRQGNGDHSLSSLPYLCGRAEHGHGYARIVHGTHEARCSEAAILRQRCCSSGWCRLRRCACPARASIPSNYRHRDYQRLRLDYDGLAWPARDFCRRAWQRNRQSAHPQHYPCAGLSRVPLEVIPIFCRLLEGFFRALVSINALSASRAEPIPYLALISNMPPYRGAIHVVDLEPSSPPPPSWRSGNGQI